ncbi:MAG: ABC transporter permease, partial [bacterium]|nr:ABC transporter permease [bacterium]
ERLHLDGSVVSQYGSWMGDVLRGDLGQSLQSTRPVLDTIGDRLPITLWLIGLGMAFALIIAIPLGVIGGLTRSNWYKQGFSLSSAALIATPPFVSGVLLLLVFGVRLQWVPVAGYVDTFPQNLEYLLLPGIVTGIPVGMIFAIVLQESIRETNAEEFVETGLVWGLAKPQFIWRYLLRPSIAPVIGLMGYIVGANLAAAVIVETVFNLEGVGTYLVRAVLARDYPVVQGTLFTFGFIVVAVHFLSDTVSALIDPRARTIS